MESLLESLERGSPKDLLDILKRRLAAYLQKMNEVQEKESRSARLEDLREITPNFDTLKRHLDKLENGQYIVHLQKGHEHHYVKSWKGRRMEEILLRDWRYINDLDDAWRGKLPKGLALSM